MKLPTGRLAAVEARAPKPFQQFTIVRSIVSPNGPGGCDGDPIEEGVHSRETTHRHDITTTEIFDPWHVGDLPPVLTDKQVAQYHATHAELGRGQSMKLWRNRPEGAALVITNADQTEITIPLAADDPKDTAGVSFTFELDRPEQE
jgi:hypothetical protein